MNATLISWVGTYLMHSTLLIAAVWLAARWIRSASVRDALWKLALIGALMTTAIQLTVPFERLLPQAAPQRMVVDVAPQAVAALPEVAAAAVSHTRETQPVQRPFPFAIVAFAIWIAGALFFSAKLLYGRSRLLSLLATRREVVLGGDRALLDELSRDVRCRRVVRLTESASIQSPMAMLGWEIVVPQFTFGRLSDGQRRTILAHELAHLMRRDPLWLAVAEVMKAVLFFQPLNRLVQLKLKETAEFLCDDAAVLQTGDRQALAETLAELASTVLPMPASVAAMAEGGSNLIVRVSRVLRGHGRPDLPLRVRTRLAIAVVPLLVLALFAPGVAPALTKAVTPAPLMAAAVAPPARVDAVTAAPHAVVPRVVDGVVRAVLSAASKSAAPAEHLDGTFNRFGHMKLGQKFQGPNGLTNVKATAEDTEVALDASWIRFMASDGFIHVEETSERGPDREADVRPGRDGNAVFHYIIDGAEEPWCHDAELLLASSWMAEKAYAGGAVAATTRDTTTLKPSSSASDGMHTWNALLELTGERDGVPTHLQIRIVDVRYNPTTGEVDFVRNASLVVEERVGERWRQFTRDASGAEFKGSWNGESQESRKAWLMALLRKNTEVPASVLRNLAK
ncbi:MAG: hypothetical protein QOH21_2389 [Acidobacteriota bacterium]|jgi:beta-lactamase regulating signal transducer with metallopeptidase domain|nr:hypothetical protein [Acidobacteriota bacterium]